MFVRWPELLVFDDLSSALDVETERLLWERLSAQRGGPTVRDGEHRRAALQRADRFVVLKGGRVEAEGAPQRAAGKQRGAARALAPREESRGSRRSRCEHLQ